MNQPLGFRPQKDNLFPLGQTSRELCIRGCYMELVQTTRDYEENRSIHGGKGG